MKRIFLYLCAAILLLTCTAGLGTAMADGVNVDFSTATDAELEAAIQAIQNELAGRKSTRNGGADQGDDRGKKISNGNGVSLTVLDVKQTKGTTFPADDGKIIVLLELQIENDSSEEVSINSLFGFEAVCDDYSVDYSFTADLNTSSSIDTTDLKAGRKLKGWKGFEVPENWHELIVTFTPNVSLFGNDGKPIEVRIINQQ